MKKTFVLLLALSSLVSACGSGRGSGGAQAPTPRNKPEIKEKTDQEYFEQFVLKLEGDCKNPEAIRFHYLQSDSISLGRSQNGRPLIGRIEV